VQNFVISFWERVKKGQMKKRIVNFILYILLVTACVPQKTSATLQATVTLLPTKTFAPTATFAPEPTKTPDPLTGSPEGTTSKNSNGEWTKNVMENSEETTYVYLEIKPSSQNEPPYSGWFQLLTPVLIPLLDRGVDSWAVQADMIPLSVYVNENLQGLQLLPSITHQNITKGGEENFGELLLINLAERKFNKKATSIPIEEREKFYKSLEYGTAIPFTTSTGLQEWKPSKNVGVKVFFVNWNDEVFSDNRFDEWKNPGYDYGTDQFRSKVYVDDKGNLISLIAYEKSFKELPDIVLRELVIFHLVSVINSADLTYQGFSTKLDIFTDWAGERFQPPYLEIIHTQ
jgi:hypothetical protein